MDEASKRSQTAARPRGRRRWVYYWIAGIVLLALIAGAAIGPIMSRVEQPEYRVEVSDGAFEVRAHGPMIAAEAAVEGERRAAINEGFRLLAAHIFGANKPNAKVAMTAPVQQQQQTIAMTAPVTQLRRRQYLDGAVHHAEVLDDGVAADAERRSRKPQGHSRTPFCRDHVFRHTNQRGVSTKNRRASPLCGRSKVVDNRRTAVGVLQSAMDPSVLAT